jgi:hypothetical protein
LFGNNLNFGERYRRRYLSTDHIPCIRVQPIYDGLNEGIFGENASRLCGIPVQPVGISLFIFFGHLLKRLSDTLQQ